jgi:hypothetical protein
LREARAARDEAAALRKRVQELEDEKEKGAPDGSGNTAREDVVPVFRVALENTMPATQAGVKAMAQKLGVAPKALLKNGKFCAATAKEALLAKLLERLDKGDLEMPPGMDGGEEE